MGGLKKLLLRLFPLLLPQKRKTCDTMSLPARARESARQLCRHEPFREFRANEETEPHDGTEKHVLVHVAGRITYLSIKSPTFGASPNIAVEGCWQSRKVISTEHQTCHLSKFDRRRHRRRRHLGDHHRRPPSNSRCAMIPIPIRKPRTTHPW